MQIKDRKLFLIYILLIFTSLPIIQINSIQAADLTTSQYEINLILDYPQKIFSETVAINRSSSNSINSADNKNNYLESFILKNKKGKEIPVRYIKIETPYLQEEETLDKRQRYLIMKKNQEKSWFKIGLSKEAAFLEPGQYTGIIEIDDLEWQIKVTALIKPFVNFSIDDNTFEFEIAEPFQSNFFITDDLFQIDIISNHNDWEIQGQLEEFTNGQGSKLDPEYLFYRLEADLKKDKININQNQFSNFKKDENIIMISGNNYNQDLKGIRFGVDLSRDKDSIQPAGIYKGRIIFTLRNLNN